MSILNRKNRTTYLSLIGFVVVLVLAGFSTSATAASISDITFPIAELGNCASQQDCHAYCAIASNYSKCAEFGQKNGLTVPEPAFFTAMQNGESPGQCKDEASCRAYCEDTDHIEECVSFVERFNLASEDELKEIRIVANAKKAGVAFPGDCKTKASCEAYCENSAHVAECMEFALNAGFIPQEDSDVVRNKLLPYIKRGGTFPGGCTRKESCDAYCAVESHINECADFAVGAGFATEEEARIMRLTGGQSPGNCRSLPGGCDAYCREEAHIDECMDFAVRVGIMTQAEADFARQHNITSGPGGCKNKADCTAFCAVNQEVCIKWGEEHGIDMGGPGGQGPGNAADCARVGGDWDGERCELGESACADQGGTWGLDNETGKETCNFGGMMGPSRAEFEACLGKNTCDEFNSCIDALIGNQQPAGQEQKMAACLGLSCSEFEGCVKSLQQGDPQQGPQDETSQKIQERSMACPKQGQDNSKFEAKMMACQDEKIDVCLSKSCGEFQACLNSLSSGQPGGDQRDQNQEQGTPNPKLDAKFKSCQEELKEAGLKEAQAKQAACLSKSCGEFESCLKALQQGGDQSGQQQQGQRDTDPAVEAKIQACQQAKVDACLAKPCSEFQACLNSLGGEQQQSGEQQQGTPNPAVDAKFKTCFPPPPQN